MKPILSPLLVASTLLLAAGPLLPERKPLPAAVEVKKIKHEPTGTTLRRDPKTGQWVEHRLDGEIIYEEKTGNFLLRWTGMDGRRKTVVYTPATRLDAVISATVEYAAEQSAYQYSYLLSNLPTSQRKLQSFYLETQAPVERVEAPDESWGYSTALTDYLQEQFEVKAGWTWSQTRQGRVGLSPGESVAGFSFVSSGLPAVMKCYVRHHAYMKGTGEEVPEELMAALDPLAWKIPQGVTVGPALPPEPFQPAAFARRIRNMVDISAQQGWIESPGLKREFDHMLAQVEDALAKQEKARTSSLLRSLLTRVEAENGKTLLSEAYALLRFNLEYLARQLHASTP